MRVLLPLIAVGALSALALGGVAVAHLQPVFGIVIPYVAMLAFIIGFVCRVLKWARAPVPFRIPTTCGQQKSLPWIKQAPIDNPSGTLGVIARMALEVFLFRSLLRNSRADIMDGQKVAYASNKVLWLAGLVFHYSFLVILVRHCRFFIQPVPALIRAVEGLDSILQIGIPLIYLTDAALIAAVTYLLLRRIVFPKIRYISLPADYFPLFLLLTIALTGISMRYFAKVDTVGVKELAVGLLSFHPISPEGIAPIFYVHLFLVCVLLVYFPFSKLMHMGGVFLSPTRNLANNNRMRRHENPWNHPVKTHPYEEYENEFRDKMLDAGIPLDKES